MKPMNETLRRLLLLELAELGYPHAEYDPKTGFIHPLPEEPLLIVTEGGATFYENAPGSIKQLSHTLNHPYLDGVRDMWQEWEAGRPMLEKADEGYRVLAENGKCLLAARDDGPDGLHFVVWDYTYGRGGVTQGDYTTSYESAREMFAERAGLVDKDRLITPAEAMLLYEAIQFPDDGALHPTAVDGKAMDALSHKLLRVIQSSGTLHDQAPEPQLEM